VCVCVYVWVCVGVCMGEWVGGLVRMCLCVSELYKYPLTCACESVFMCVYVVEVVAHVRVCLRLCVW